MPPHRARTLRRSKVRRRLPNVGHRAADAGVRLGEANDVLLRDRGRRVCLAVVVGRVTQYWLRVARETQVVLHALGQVRKVCAVRVVALRRVGAFEISKVEFHVHARRVLGRTDGLRITVVTHNTDGDLRARGRVVGVNKLAQRAIVRIRRRGDGRGATEDRFCEVTTARHRRRIDVDGPRHGFTHRRAVVGRRRRSRCANLCVQVQVVVHRVHGDAEIVIAVVGLDKVVRVSLRVNDG
mmetsp:Transcript_9004/g.30377  ORF Transcript_9004/g.30377 Transcript_9004/m.30377 type:complete len:239 (+) Transcript_9004:1402-2118(+)